MSSTHGGNVYEVAAQLGCSPDSILDYSASINPKGPPPGLLENIQRHFHWVRHYPDINNRVLKEALAAFHGVPPGRVVVGNGSTELIYWLPRVLGIRRALVVLPTFSEYQRAFEIEGVELCKVFTSADDAFQPSLERLEANCDRFRPEAVLVTHPGSPAGTLLPPSVQEWLLDMGKREELTCLVDEAFIDFCEDESLKKSLTDTSGIVLIRSMTKFYGIPGLRVGYLLTSERIAQRMRQALPPWSVNTLAQLAGEYCLGQDSYRRETLQLVRRERDALMKKLAALESCTVFPGVANYVLVQLDKSLPPARILRNDLLAWGNVLVRDCSSFEGLDDHYVRLAIRLPEENQRLFELIEKWVRFYR